MNRVCLLATVLLMAARVAPGLAEEPAPKLAPNPSKPICRTERGSRSLAQTQRICHTREEWDRLATDTERDLSNASRANGQSQAAMVPQPR